MIWIGAALGVLIALRRARRGRQRSDVAEQLRDVVSVRPVRQGRYNQGPTKGRWL